MWLSIIDCYVSQHFFFQFPIRGHFPFSVFLHYYLYTIFFFLTILPCLWPCPLLFFHHYFAHLFSTFSFPFFINHFICHLYVFSSHIFLLSFCNFRRHLHLHVFTIFSAFYTNFFTISFCVFHRFFFFIAFLSPFSLFPSQIFFHVL